MGGSVRIKARDGAVLRGELHVPVGGPAGDPAGDSDRVPVVILSHAMMANRRSLDRPRGNGLLTRLVDAGAVVLAMDQRGHGESEGRGWTYDDLVDDAGVVADHVAERFPGAERIAIGHSLFGHVALAHQARHGSYDRMALFGVQVWLRTTEPDRRRWRIKQVVATAARCGLRLLPQDGAVPVRRLGLGSDDVSVRFLTQVFTWARRNDWAGLDGDSWLVDLPRVTVPILSIAGAGDRLLSPPSSQEAFVRRTTGPVRHRVVGRATGHGFDPGHMALVLDPRMDPVWRQVARFALGGPY